MGRAAHMGTIAGSTETASSSYDPATARTPFADQVEAEYDYIVVGSGAGGGIVAARLAKAGFCVLLLEAGGADEPPEYKIPAFHPRATEHPKLSWNFFVHH